jgi:hypothetical protein
MRMIARGNTPENCTKRVNQLKKEGWKPITDVKLDPSPSIDLSWVCVLERDLKGDIPESFGKKRRFNHGRYGPL